MRPGRREGEIEGEGAVGRKKKGMYIGRDGGRK